MKKQASADRMIKLWNPQTGLCIKTYIGHGKDVLGLALPPLATENTRFVSCSADRSIVIWDVISGKPIKRYTGHSARVNSVQYNRDTSVVVSARFDSFIVLYLLNICM